MKNTYDDYIYDQNVAKTLVLEAYQNGTLVRDDLADYIFEFTEKHYYNTNDSFYLIGLVPSKEFSLSFNNVDKILDQNLINYDFKSRFEVSSDNVVFDKSTFNIYNNPEKFTNTLSLDGNDKIALLDIPYDSQLNYSSNSITVENQIDEISSIVGVEFDKSNLDTIVKNIVINFYDNTISIRDYVSWIAEINVSNVQMSGDKFVFKKLTKTAKYDVPLEYVTDLYTREEFEISGVVFNNANIVTFTAGDDTKNVVYLREANPYVLNQDIVDNVYNQLVGLSFVSFESVHMVIGNPTIEIGDTVNFVNEDGTTKFIGIVMSNQTKFAGGFVTDLEGKISNQISELTVNRYDTSVRIKNIIVNLDRNNNTLDILAKNVEDNVGKIGELFLSDEEIKTSVSKVEEKLEQTNVYIRDVIESSDGYYLNGDIQYTVLTARMYQGNEEVDPNGSYTYTWYIKKDNDLDYSILGVGKTITMQKNFVNNAKVYFIAENTQASVSAIVGTAVVGTAVI